MARLALVVDDSMLIRHTVCRFLEERGYRAESATNGREALDMMKAWGAPPHVILTDMVMPTMSGGELIEHLKANPKTASIPIVLLVSKHNPEPAAAAKHAVYVIYKDIDILEQLEKALVAAGGKSIPAKRAKAKPQRKTPGRRNRRPKT